MLSSNIIIVPFLISHALLCYADIAISPGLYESEGGWGTLTITKSNQFEILIVDTNGNICTLEGNIRGRKGLTSDEECKITLTPEPSAIKITAETSEVCQLYCGRAWFFVETTYYLPSAACTSKSRKQRKTAFLRLYKNQQYDVAFETLSSLKKECGRFFDWIEKDRVANDLAITMFHIGNKAECINLLQSTRGWNNRTPEDLQGDLPPMDYYNYLPVAKATGNNIKLCQKLK